MNINLNNIIEFFDPIKQRTALSKKKSTGKIKDKGSTQKHNYGNKVPADDSSQDEHGRITFYGFVEKQRFKYNAFHSRWIVLRGFNLYWYRSPADKQQKGNIMLPSVNLQMSKVGKEPSFII